MLSYMWLWLSQKKGLGARRFQQLLERFDTVDELYAAAPGKLLRAGLTPQETELLADKDLSEAKTIEEDCQRLGIHILCWDDPAYPALLRQIPDPPLVLYYQGRLPDLDNRPSIALVGARKASAYGLSIARTMGYQLARCGAITVTGLAKGVDAAACEGALIGDGQVIGVLGCGLDVIYPASSARYYRELEVRGCLLSEYPPGTPPLGYHFPVRNRIISGLSDGVVVAEAGEKSGSLITARLALDQGRDVFAVPGPVNVAACAGSNRLLKEGAFLAENGWEAAREYESRYPHSLTAFTGEIPADETFEPEPDERPLPETAPAITSQAEPAKAEPPGQEEAGSRNEPRFPLSDQELARRLEGRSPEEQRVIRALRSGPMQLDLLIVDAGLPAARVLSTLTMLELRRCVKRLGGSLFTLQ